MEQGLSNEKVVGGNYLNFKDGEILSNKTPYKNITGRIVELDVTDETYLNKDYKKLTLFIKAGDKIYKLGMPLSSGYGNAFCMMMPNVDWKEDVTISGNFDVDDNGKKRGGMFINQGKKAIKWFWTKDAPGKLPQPVKSPNGDFNWDKRNQYLLKLLYEKVRPAILKANPGVSVDKTQPKKKDKVTTDADITEPIDDLPF